jgi:hypothetical protein
MPVEMVEQKDETSLLPGKLRLVLWKRVDRRLQRGEVLITTEHFQQVMEREFRRVVGVRVTPPVRQAIRQMIERVNLEHPETFLTLGIKNAVTLYFRDLQQRMQGQSSELQAESRKRIVQMVREGRTAFFLESIGVEVGERGVPRSVQKAIEKIVSGERLEPPPEAARLKAKRKRRAAEMAQVHRSQAAKEAEEEGPAQAALPNAQEQQERIEKMRSREREITEEELGKARQYLESYRQQELLDDEEMATLRKLYGIEERLAAGEIDREEAERLRGQIDEKVRSRLDQRLRAAVDYAVHYLSTFESLRRVPKERDAALRLLVRHKELVMEEDEEADMSPLIEELDQDEELLEQVSKIMERRDHETRMISANLPPYRYITGQGKIGNLMIEEEFIDELRNLEQEELSARLNAAEAEVRVKPAANMRCLVALINQAIDPTPFHLAVLRLQIRKTISHLYRSVSDSKTGRHKVTHFLSQRLHRLYPNMSREDRTAIEKESQEIMAAIDAERKKDERKEEMRVYRV